MNNKQVEITGLSEEEYLKWCKENKKLTSKKESKREFFKYILSKRKEN